jgi:hypothetical protein
MPNMISGKKQAQIRKGGNTRSCAAICKKEKNEICFSSDMSKASSFIFSQSAARHNLAGSPGKRSPTLSLFGYQREELQFGACNKELDRSDSNRIEALSMG